MPLRSDPVYHSNPPLFQTDDQVGDTLLDTPPLDPQQPIRFADVPLEGLVRRRQLAPLDPLSGQPVFELREPFPHGSRDLLVVKVSRRGEQPLAPDLWLVHGQDVRLGDIPHVDPEGHWALRGDLVLPPTAEQGYDALVGGVDAVQGGEVVDHGAEDQRGTDGDEIEAGLLLFYKVPGGPLSERLAHAVRRRLGAVDIFQLGGVPALLGEGVVRVEEVLLIQHAGEGARDNDPPDAGRGLLERLEDTRGADNGGVDQLRLGVGPVEVERRRGVQDDLEARRLDHLVKGGGLGDVGDDVDEQTRLGHGVGVGGQDVVGLGLGSHGGVYGVVKCEKLIEDVRGDEAGAAWS